MEDTHHFEDCNVLGEITWLMLQSDTHKKQRIGEIAWLVLPPIHLKQFRIFRKAERPIAYVSWASVNQNVERQILSGKFRLDQQDWNSGEQLWMIDIIAPFGGEAIIKRELQQRVFVDRPVKMLQTSSKGELHVQTW